MTEVQLWGGDASWWGAHTGGVKHHVARSDGEDSALWNATGEFDEEAKADCKAVAAARASGGGGGGSASDLDSAPPTPAGRKAAALARALAELRQERAAGWQASEAARAGWAAERAAHADAVASWARERAAWAVERASLLAQAGATAGAADDAAVWLSG